MTIGTRADGAPAGKAGRREWIGLAVLLLPLLLVSMDVSVLYFAVPFIGRALEPSGTQQLWILDMYGFVLSGLLIVMGALGDRIGRRRLLLVGAGIFAGASLAAAYSGSAEALIAARAALGVGGAALMPSTLALIRTMFVDAKQRSTAIAIWTAVMTGGISLGPILSGVLVEHFWWGSIFVINVPAMALLLLLVPVFVPHHRGTARGPFDAIGALLSLGTLLPVVYGIKESARSGVSPLSAASIAFGLIVGALFLRRQLTIEHPLLDVGLLRMRAFGGSVVANLLAMFAIIGFAIFTTQYLQSVLGMSPLEAAIWSLVPSLAVALAAPVAAMLAQRMDRGWVMSGGFALGAVGFAVLATVDQDSPLALTMTGAAVYAAGIVAVMTQVTEMAMGVAPPERAGSASAVLESGSELGGALGMALLGTIGDAVYHRAMTDTTAPGSARETLGGAQAEAARMPREAGDALVHAARDAFCDGMRAAAVGAAVVMVLASVYCVKVLRGVPVAGSGAESEAGAGADAGAGVEAGVEVAVEVGAKRGVEPEAAARAFVPE
ncbi:MFS transporter [Streptomyces sp. SID3343]|uniref:MFS transporter n=1 Tax=Streptomyces sp. SID3343 TaxID=2690260 RepID=UPI00136E1FCB|nr:MFS transporter [Streptomyces sp. SID3343]MYV97123.1 MFS transporter [Streptomyces sp. SID3343]